MSFLSFALSLQCLQVHKGFFLQSNSRRLDEELAAVGEIRLKFI